MREFTGLIGTDDETGMLRWFDWKKTLSDNSVMDTRFAITRKSGARPEPAEAVRIDDMTPLAPGLGQPVSGRQALLPDRHAGRIVQANQQQRGERDQNRDGDSYPELARH